MSRYTDLAREDMSPRQQEIHDQIASGPRGAVPSVFRMLLHAPEVADRVQQLGVHLRYGTSLPARLSELAIICVARHWNSKYEWYWHCRDALAGGVPRHEVEAIAEGQRPTFDDPVAEAVYEFAVELLEDQSVSDDTYGRVVDALGVPGAVELTVIIGNYQNIAGVLSVFEIPLPGEAEIELKV